MANSFEVGDRVKLEVDNLPYAGTVITYDDVDYKVSVDGLGKVDRFEESGLTLLPGGGGSIVYYPGFEDKRLVLFSLSSGVWSGGLYDIVEVPLGENQTAPTPNYSNNGVTFTISTELLKQVMKEHCFEYVEFSGWITSVYQQELGLVKLGEQLTAASSITLNDSIFNYSVIALQGVWNNDPQSTFDTTLFYHDVSLNIEYIATMKDRHGLSTAGVTFTDATHASLTCNKRCVIYGM